MRIQTIWAVWELPPLLLLLTPLTPEANYTGAAGAGMRVPWAWRDRPLNLGVTSSW